MADEWAIVSDEGVIEDGFYSREEAEARLRRMGEEGEGLEVDRRDKYDDEGNWIEDEDEDEELGAAPIACGECFEWAYYNLPRTGAVLVQASVQPFGGKYGDRRYPHAWIERSGRIYDWQSVAQGLGPGAKGWAKKKFYAVYAPQDVQRYDYDESRVEAVRHHHYGPWVD